MDLNKTEQVLLYISGRLKEPSTYNAIGVALAAFGLSIAPGIVQDCIGVATAVSVVLGICMKEGSSN